MPSCETQCEPKRSPRPLCDLGKHLRFDVPRQGTTAPLHDGDEIALVEGGQLKIVSGDESRPRGTCRVLKIRPTPRPEPSGAPFAGYRFEDF